MIISKKTHEISDREIEQIYDLFESVFHKRRPVSLFRSQFGNTSLGYSFHAIAVDDETGRIVGHNAYVPFTYRDDRGRSFMLTLSIDAMLDEAYRGKGLYRQMLLTCEEAAKAEGCKIRVGFPNDNSYPVQIKGFRYHDFGPLHTYVLPVRVGAVKPSLRPLNPLSRLFAGSLSLLSRLPGGRKEHSYVFDRDSESFDSFRWKWLDGGYKHLEFNGGECTYKTTDYQGTVATFLMDVRPMSRRAFDCAVRAIQSNEPDLGLLLYVGRLPFAPLSMLRLPDRIAPKRFNFVGKVLDKEWFEESGGDVMDIGNWHLDLATFDLL